MSKLKQAMTKVAVVMITVVLFIATASVCSFADGGRSGIASAAEATPVKDFGYYISNGEAIISSYHGKSRNIVIPSEINGCPVTRIGNGVFQDYRSKLESIVLPDTIRSIGEYAFYYCSFLNSIKLPDSLETIEEYAFYECTGLSDVKFPDNLKTIGACAFACCEALEKIEIPDSITSIGGGAFSDTGYMLNGSNWVDGVVYIGNHLICANREKILTKYTIRPGTITIADRAFSTCRNMTDIDIPASVKNIGKFVFYCSGLVDVKIPDSATNIGNQIFDSCSKLEKVDLPDGITGISVGMFMNCIKLRSIDIPDGVTSIEYGAFSGCTILSEIEIPGGVTTIGGSAFKGCTALTSIEIPGKVESIGSNAFYGCTGLTSMKFPNSVTQIGPYAFGNCKNLKDIELSENMTCIDEYTFKYCTALTDVKIPDSVKSIQRYAFYACNGLKNVGFSANLESIGDYAFAECKQLTEIELFPGLKTLGNYTFFECFGLTSAKLPGSLTRIVSTTFGSCKNLDDIYYGSSENEWNDLIGDIYFGAVIHFADGSIRTYGDGYIYTLSDGKVLLREYRSLEKEVVIPSTIGGYPVVSISENVFRGCADITSVKIPDGVINIGDYAFYRCFNLKSIEIPDSVTGIGTYAFYGSMKLEKVKIPGSVKNIDSYAFCYTGLRSVEILDGVKTIGDYAFSDNSLHDIKIPDSVTSIGDYAFFDCSNMIKSEISGNATYVGDYAFSGCINLREIVIPDSVTYLGEGVFSNCSNLCTVQLSANIEKICPKAFSDCIRLSSIKIPEKVTSIEHQAFYNCSGMTEIELPESIKNIGYYALKNKNLKDVYYAGSEDNWFIVTVDEGNQGLLGATMHFAKGRHTHAYISAETEAATCTTEGVMTYTCFCGGSYTEAISATGHKETVIDAVEPTCTATGLTEGQKCSVCDEILQAQEVVGVMPHEMEGWQTVQSPDCTEKGLKKRECANCEYAETEEIEANGHNEVSISVAVESTCTTTGLTEGSKCSVCEEIFEDCQIVPKLPHTMEEWKISQAPTCTEDGKESRKCVNCNYTETNTLVATGHKETTLAGKSATYTSEGLTVGKKCSVCGKITVAQKTIAKLTLGKVSGLKAKKVKVAKSSEITLTWNAVTGAKGYEIYQQNGSSWKKIKTTSGTSYTVKKLKANKTYKFKVRAVVDEASGAYSSTLKVETIPATATLKLKASKKQLTASWSKVSDISGYEVQYSTSKKFSKKTTKTVKVKKSSKKTTIKKLKKGKKYYVRVRTYKTVNGKKIYSGWSTVKNVKVK